jgi:DNA polymerase III delta subunit
MNYQEAFKKINTNNLIALVGDEDFLKDQIKNKIINTYKDYELVKIDASNEDEKEIFFRLKYKDLFKSKKIFYIKNFLKIKSLDFFLENNLDDVIILESKEKGKSKNFNEITKKFLFIECFPPKKWEEENDALIKIESFFKKNGFLISEGDSRYLFSLIGYDLYKIIRESQKILMYKENLNDNKIYKKDIDAVCNFDTNYNIFDLVEKIIDNNKKSALDLLNKIYKYETNPSILLITTIYTHFENLIYVKNNNKYGSHIKIPQNVIDRKIKPQASKLSESKILDSLIYFSNLDFNLRKGIFDLRFHIEKFILNF